MDGFNEVSKFSSHSNNNYNVLVQDDFLNENPDIKNSRKINFMGLTNFDVYSSVRFNQVTYPAMGLNFLPDEKKQAFLGMTLSDYIDFHQKYQTYFSSFSSYTETLFMGSEKGYDSLNSLNS